MQPGGQPGQSFVYPGLSVVAWYCFARDEAPLIARGVWDSLHERTNQNYCEGY